MTKERKAKKKSIDQSALAKIISDNIKGLAAIDIANAIIEEMTHMIDEEINIHLKMTGKGKKRGLVVEVNLSGSIILSESPLHTLRFLLLEDEIFDVEDSVDDARLAVKELHMLAAEFEEYQKEYWGEEWKSDS